MNVALDQRACYSVSTFSEESSSTEVNSVVDGVVSLESGPYLYTCLCLGTFVCTSADTCGMTQVCLYRLIHLYIY